ncbi:MAG: class I SAM-dependent methyltransferase [archaeon]|nr:class I SAM-dependent methyltransferase [archaeon]
MVITNRFYIDFAKSFTEYLEHHPREIEEYFNAEKYHLGKKIDSGKTALEFGCGSGRIMEILAEKCKHVTGIDNSEPLLKIAKENLKYIDNATFYDPMEVEELDKISEKYDIITLMDNTLGNITGRDKQVRLLEKLKPLLNENGRIIISVYSDTEDTKRVQEESYEIVGLTGIKHEGNYTYTNEGLTSERFSEKSIKSLLTEVGLKAEIEELTDISYICEAKIISAAQ